MRLRQFRIGFKLHCSEACQLSRSIRDDILSDHGLPASIRFDRIEVSNILDADYVGMRSVLTYWAPLLAGSSSAAIIGYFMNWPTVQKGGWATEAGPNVVERLSRQIMEVRKVTAHRSCSRLTHRLPFKLHMESLKITERSAILKPLKLLIPEDMGVLYENSKPFMSFLKEQGLDQVLRDMKLRLREAHTIVPHVRDTRIDPYAWFHVCVSAYRGSFGRKTECVTPLPRRRELVPSRA